MKQKLECTKCHTLRDVGACPACGHKEAVLVYCCEVCGRGWFWRNNEKECCKKEKEKPGNFEHVREG